MHLIVIGLAARVRFMMPVMVSRLLVQTTRCIGASGIAALVGVLALIAPSPDAARAGEADVLGVEYQIAADGTYRFDVTVRHVDDGWEHYADRWQVLAPDGTVLGERVLLHPHDTEQPFTRSLGGVAVPEDITTVTVRADDSRHGWGGAELTIDLRD
jgi:hypothetical protein